MALILKNNSYFKIDKDGNYIVYKNKTARNKHKKACESQAVLEKYKEILESMSSREYFHYNDMNTGERKAWIDEYKSYCIDLLNNNAGGEYPLMAQYFPDVAKSIPDVLYEGRFGWATEFATLKEIYEEVKRRRIFGGEDDVKDA